MKAIIFPKHGPIDAPEALIEAERPEPKPQGRDLLVRVKAVSVNPIDYKSRQGMFEIATGGSNILGWDAAGIVEAVGPEATLFKPGDEVFYAGAFERAGSNAELQLVDERIVGPKPKTLSFVEAAALPLTTLTAWEMLFDRLEIQEGGGEGQSILIVAAAGGVGSIAVQLASRLTKLNVLGTASRPETVRWAKEFGANVVLDHSAPLSKEFEVQKLTPPKYVFITNGADEQLSEVSELIAPQGKLGLIVAPKALDIAPFYMKSVSVHWELMYTRHLYQTADMDAQHQILKRTSQLIDEGVLRTTVAENFGRISAENLISAHKLLESGKSKGKIVLEGF